MKKIGLFYAANAVKTSQVAKKIRKVLGAENVDIILPNRHGVMILRLMII